MATCLPVELTTFVGHTVSHKAAEATAASLSLFSGIAYCKQVTFTRPASLLQSCPLCQQAAVSAFNCFCLYFFKHLRVYIYIPSQNSTADKEHQSSAIQAMHVLLIMCVAVVSCLLCYSGKEAPCLLHTVTAIATLHTFCQQCT